MVNAPEGLNQVFFRYVEGFAKKRLFAKAFDLQTLRETERGGKVGRYRAWARILRPGPNICGHIFGNSGLGPNLIRAKALQGLASL